MFETIIKQIPIIGQSYGLTRTAMSVFNSTDPVSAVRNATLQILDDCSPPQIKYPIKCGVLIGQIVIVALSGGKPWSVALTIGCARQLIDK